MPKPLNLANSIQGQAYNISKNYKSFDSTFTINTVEFPVSVPNILSIPNIINVTDSSITFSISLDNYGYVFVLASPLLTEITTMSITDYISNTTNATNTTNIINNITTTTIVNNSELVPTSYQIYKGLNSKNLDTNVLSQSLEISAKSRNFSFVFSGLNQNTSYILFVTVGNVHPYLPDLADNSKIVKLYGTTLVKKGFSFLYNLLNFNYF